MSTAAGSGRGPMLALATELARAAARRAGVYERVMLLRRLGIGQSARVALAKAFELKRLDIAPPIPSQPGTLEVHMLLHHARLREGGWAFYSFAHFAQVPLHFVVHSDGSLTAADQAWLRRLLPGCEVIDRGRADAVARQHLEGAGFARCQRLRDSLVFGLKLFDPFFFVESSSFVLLDSDVLFSGRPSAVLEGSDDPQAPPLYSPDNGYRYCLSEAAMVEVLGRPCVERFNPGVVRVPRGLLSLERVERYLERPEFWNEDGTGNYYGELTLWAMELTQGNAQALPASYAICPDFRHAFVSGHYCGGGYWSSIYYSDILPHLARVILGPPS